MWLLIAGLAILIIPGAWAFSRAERELVGSGRLSTVTFAAALVAYVGHATVTLIAAWTAAWPMPLGRSTALIGGGLLAITGGAIYLVARLQFRSFRLTWGLQTNRLITGGIYRLSRNPQVLGAVLFLLGIAVLGRSAVAVALSVVVFLASIAWVPREERVLEELFGDRYRQYRAATPRFLGIPRTRQSRPKVAP